MLDVSPYNSVGEVAVGKGLLTGRRHPTARAGVCVEPGRVLFDELGVALVEHRDGVVRASGRVQEVDDALHEAGIVVVERGVTHLHGLVESALAAPVHSVRIFCGGDDSP